MEASDIFGKQGMRQLRQMQLPKAGRTVLDGLLDCIEYLDQSIRGVESKLRRVMKPDPRTEWLRTIPGVGRLTAYFLIAEIGEIERFPSPAKLVSYCGLAPSTRQSGSRTRHGSTKGAGNRLLKWVLVEASHTAVRRDSYFASVFHRFARKKGKGKAYVIVAHRMAKIVWKMLTERRPYIPKQKKTQVGSRGMLTGSGR